MDRELTRRNLLLSEGVGDQAFGESGLLALLRTKHTDLLDSIRRSGDLSSADEAKLKEVVDGYAKTFA